MDYFSKQLNAVRKQIKPVSGTVGMKKKLEEENAKLRAQHQAMQNALANEDIKKRGSSSVMKTPTKDRGSNKPSNLQKSPAVSRNAKKKWEMLERKVCVSVLDIKCR